MFVETLWKVWVELLDVLGLDGNVLGSNKFSRSLICPAYTHMFGKWIDTQADRHQEDGAPSFHGARAYTLKVSNMSQYFSPTSVSSSPTRAMLLVSAVLLAYWFLSLALGFAFSLLHLLCGRFLWVVRALLFSMSCVYILHKYEGEPESAVLPLCFVVALYFMTGPMGCHWRSSPPGPGVEEKLEHLENQVRLLNVRLNRVLEVLDRTKDK
ncbi:BRI3-binding protein isoform X3 [Tamandua tetradactyla]